MILIHVMDFHFKGLPVQIQWLVVRVDDADKIPSRVSMYYSGLSQSMICRYCY